LILRMYFCDKRKSKKKINVNKKIK
jgi:hypothetical protein